MKQFVTSECVYLSANRFSMAWENGIQMPFTFFVFAWHWKTDFVFRFRFTLKNGYEFQFSFFVFASLWKTDMNFVFRFRITLKNGFKLRFSFSHHFEKRVWISFFVFVWLVMNLWCSCIVEKNDCKTWFVILCYLAFCDFKFYSLQIFVIFLFHRAYTSVAIAAPKSTCFFRGYHHIICNPLLKRSTVCGGHIMGAGEFTTHFGPGEEKIQLLSFA